MVKYSIVYIMRCPGVKGEGSGGGFRLAPQTAGTCQPTAPGPKDNPCSAPSGREPRIRKLLFGETPSGLWSSEFQPS